MSWTEFQPHPPFSGLRTESRISYVLGKQKWLPLVLGPRLTAGFLMPTSSHFPMGDGKMRKGGRELERHHIIHRYYDFTHETYSQWHSRSISPSPPGLTHQTFLTVIETTGANRWSRVDRAGEQAGSLIGPWNFSIPPWAVYCTACQTLKLL